MCRFKNTIPKCIAPTLHTLYDLRQYLITARHRHDIEQPKLCLTLDDKFDDNQEHDAAEFLMYTLECLHKETTFNNIRTSNSFAVSMPSFDLTQFTCIPGPALDTKTFMQWLKYSCHDQPSLVTCAFTGMIRTQYRFRCIECGVYKESTSYEPYNVLVVSMSPSGTTDRNAKVEMDRLIDGYEEQHTSDVAEKFDGRSCCKLDKFVHTQLHQVVKYPNITLIVHVPRVKATKNTSILNFHRIRRNDINMLCRAVIIHYPARHYQCAIKTEEYKWLIVNDNQVNMRNNNEIISIINKCAILFFYDVI